MTVVETAGAIRPAQSVPAGWRTGRHGAWWDGFAALAAVPPALVADPGTHVWWLTVAFAAAMVLLWPVVVYAHGGYRAQAFQDSLAARVAPVSKSVVTLLAVGFVWETLFPLPWSTRTWTVALLVAGTCSMLVRAGDRRARTPIRVVGIGPADQVFAVVDRLSAGHDGRQIQLAGLEATTGSFDDAEVARAASTLEVDAVVALATLDHGAIRRLGWLLAERGIELYVTTPILDADPSRTRMVRAGHLGLLQVGLAERPVARRIKAVAERAAAAGLLLVAAPLLLALALAIRLDSPGAAVFRQGRVGKDGRMFTMYKLRTMRTDAEAAKARLAAENPCDGVLFKMERDPRVTRVGAVLRRFSLDELPQLVNVVLGDMALIGPRPALPDEVAKYDVDPRRRLAVKPGLTGLWQVSGRSDLSWEETVRLDLRYVDNWSLGLDLTILCRTVGAVLRQRGAY